MSIASQEQYLNRSGNSSEASYGNGQGYREAEEEEDVRENIREQMELFTQLFDEYADEGIVSGDDLLAILHECGMAISEDTLRDLVTGSWEEMDIEACTDILIQLRDASKSKNTNRGFAEGSSVTRIQTVSLFQFLGLVLTCSRDPAITYSVKRPSCTVQPKQLLISSIGTVMLLTGALLILLVALLWIRSAEDTEETTISRFGIAVDSFIESYDAVFLRSFGSEMADMAKELSFFEDLRFLNIANATRLRIQKTSEMLTNDVDFTTSTKVDSDFAAMNGYMKTIVRLARAGSEAALVQRLNEAFVTNRRFKLPWRVHVVNDTTNTLVYETPSPSCGANCDLTAPCLNPATTNTVASLRRTVDPFGVGSMAVGVHLSSLHLKICASATQNEVQALASGVAVNKVGSMKSHLEDILKISEISVVTPQSGNSYENPKLNFVTPLGVTPAMCYSAGACNEADRVIAHTLVTRRANSTFGTPNRADEQSIIVAAATSHELAFTIERRRQSIRDEEYERLKELFAFLNDIRIFQLGSTIEVVLVLRNTTTQALYQASPYAFIADCLGECIRSPFSLENAVDGYNKRDSGFSITPDYRPEAVMGGYGYSVLDAVQIVILVERDIIEMRGLAMNSLTDMVQTNNAQFFGTFEVQLVHNQGQKLQRTYDPRDPCPAGVPCRSVPEHDLVYRDDCRHCTRQERIETTAVVHLTPPKLITECKNCSATALLGLRDIGYRALIERDTTGRYIESTDYRDQEVLGYIGYNNNFSTAFYMKVDRSEVFDPIMDSVFVSLGSSIAMVVVALVVLMILSRNFITRIESEWLNYKENIVKQREEFGELVREVIPPHIAERAMTDSFMYAENENVCIMFTDANDFTSRMKDWPDDAFARAVTYVHHAMSIITQHYDLYRVRHIGDEALFLCGLGESMEGDSTKERNKMQHPVFRTLCAATNLQQLCIPRYAHFPTKNSLITKVFGNERFTFPGDAVKGPPPLVGDMQMPVFRIGVHVANTAAHVVPIGMTPHFDTTGLSTSLAHRMMSTCRNRCVHVTDSVRDTVDRLDGEKTFKFGKGKSIIIRGRGNVVGYTINSGDVTVPQSVMNDLSVKFAKLQIDFLEKPKGRDAPVDGSMISGMTGTTATTDTTDSSY